MRYTDLRDFIAQLERLGELKRIKTEVDPHLEMTEICDRVLREYRETPMPVSSSFPLSPRPIHHHRHAHQAHHRADDIESIRLYVIDQPP